jgi:hypothetical protein
MMNPELTLRLAYERHAQLVRDAENWNARHRADPPKVASTTIHAIGRRQEIAGPDGYPRPRQRPLTAVDACREERDPAA